MSEIDKLEKEQMATRKEYQVMLRDIITSMDKMLSQSEGLSAKKSPASTSSHKPASGATSKNKPVNDNTAAKPANTKVSPVKPEPEKDFSGFGDTDFDDDKID